MNKKQILKKYFFCLIITLLTTQVKSIAYRETLEVVAEFNIIQFKVDSQTINCTNCMPAGIKLSENGTIFCSFPRWYDNVLYTFGKYDNETKYFEPWPSPEANDEKNPSGFRSILGFEIDKEDNIYILDQGKIKNETAPEKSIKLLKYSLKNNSLLDVYYFGPDIADPDNSFLNDIVIDQEKQVAYISDSGISNDKILEHYKPGIIVLDLKNKENVHKILTNHSSVFPDKSFWLHIDDKPVNNNSPMMTGVDGIALSCDGRVLYYCPLTGRMIYSIFTEEIEMAIKNNKTDEIPVYEGFKKEASDGLLATSKNSLYITGIESGSIYIVNEIEEDLLRLDYRDFDTFEGNKSTIWPDTMAIYDDWLYFVTNQLNNFPDNINYNNPSNGRYNFAILRFKIGKDSSYIQGCSSFARNWGVGSIIIWICFAVIILIVLSFVLMGSNTQEEVIDKHMNLGIKED